MLDVGFFSYDWFLANWITVLAIASLAFGVIAVLLAITFYYKPRKVKRPRYALRSLNLVRDFASSLDQLEVNYAGQRVENVTVTKAAFWNEGYDTINSSDVATADPISFAINDPFRILDSKVVYAKNPSNRISITNVGQAAVELHFEYLDKNDGAILQLVHTGESSADIKISGRIIGVGKPIEVHELKWPMKLLWIVTLYLLVPTYLLTSKVPVAYTMSMLFVGVAVLCVATYFYIGLGTKTAVPKGFEAFEQGF